jgi:hypothetical protein
MATLAVLKRLTPQASIGKSKAEIEPERLASALDLAETAREQLKAKK